MQLGFIGLGNLGKAIAGRLADCDHTLTVWNRTPAKAGGLHTAVAPTPRDLAAKADVIFLCLFDSNAVRAVLTGEDGLLAGDLVGKVIVDITTNHFNEVKAFHALCQQVGGMYLESPVLGSVAPAAQGALTVLVSGAEEGFERVRPVLEQIGTHLFYLGEPGLATKMKLINNLTIASFMATIAEAVAFAEDVGLAREEVLEILSVGGGNSMVLNAKKKKLLEEDFSPHFSNALMFKDLHCLQDLAYERKRSLFTASTVKELYARTFEEGVEREDFSAVYKLFKRQ